MTEVKLGTCAGLRIGRGTFYFSLNLFINKVHRKQGNSDNIKTFSLESRTYLRSNNPNIGSLRHLNPPVRTATTIIKCRRAHRTILQTNIH
jgi:hypothetical protein